jgi:hypothetical protein
MERKEGRNEKLEKQEKGLCAAIHKSCSQTTTPAAAAAVVVVRNS